MFKRLINHDFLPYWVSYLICVLTVKYFRFDANRLFTDIDLAVLYCQKASVSIFLNAKWPVSIKGSYIILPTGTESQQTCIVIFSTSCRPFKISTQY